MIILRADQFATRSECPLCHARASRELGYPCYQRVYETPRDLVVLDKQTIEQRVLQRCLSCGLIYNRLIPLGETLDFLYNVPTDGRTWRFVTTGRKMEEKLAFLSLLPQEQEIRVLDVGCYTGGFLTLLPDHWTKHGLDPNPEALKLASQALPGARFTQGRLESFRASEGSYELIALWDVAEHLEDVDAALQRVSALLAQGGFVVLETGDTDSLVARVMRQGWYYVNTLEHFCFFSEGILRRILPRYGLEVVACTKTIHHFDATQAWKTQIPFWSYFAVTLGGRVSTFWLALSEALNRKGASHPPASRDHMLLVAKKSSHWVPADKQSDAAQVYPS